MSDSDTSASSSSSDNSSSVFRKLRESQNLQPKPAMNIPPSIERLNCSSHGPMAAPSRSITGTKRGPVVEVEIKNIKRPTLMGNAKQDMDTKRNSMQNPAVINRITGRPKPSCQDADKASRENGKPKTAAAQMPQVQQLQMQLLKKTHVDLDAIFDAETHQQTDKRKKKSKAGRGIDRPVELPDTQLPPTAKVIAKEPVTAETPQYSSEPALVMSSAGVALLKNEIDAGSKMRMLEQEIAGLKAAVKEVMKHGGMLTAESHGQLGSAMQMLKAKLKEEK